MQSTLIAMATCTSSEEDYCVACGTCTTKKDRRLLSSPNTGKILPVWLELLRIKLQEVGRQVDENNISPRYMCRRCFSGLERYQKLQAELLDSIGSAIAVHPTWSQPTPHLEEQAQLSQESQPTLHLEEQAQLSQESQQAQAQQHSGAHKRYLQGADQSLQPLTKRSKTDAADLPRIVVSDPSKSSPAVMVSDDV